jgi:hypothetical protein
MLSMRWNRFPVCSACYEISSLYAQCAIKFVPRMLSKDCTCKNVHILPLAEHPRKFIPRMLSMRWNQFRVCSACDKIVSAYAQQISPIKNQNFEKSSRNPNNRTKVKILRKNFFGYLSKKIWFRIYSVTAETFEHRKSGKNWRKRSEIFFKNIRRAYKNLI